MRLLVHHSQEKFFFVSKFFFNFQIATARNSIYKVGKRLVVSIVFFFVQSIQMCALIKFNMHC
jgi:hypothetical protein